MRLIRTAFANERAVRVREQSAVGLRLFRWAFRNRLTRRTTTRGHMLQDYKLGLRMLLKYPGLTLAGGLALAIAIGIGAGWYDLAGKILSPDDPAARRRPPRLDRDAEYPDERARATRRARLPRMAARAANDRGSGGVPHGHSKSRRRQRGSRANPGRRSSRPPRSARRVCSPLLGRALLDSDEMPGAPGVVVLGYDVWQRSLGGRQDVVGSVVKLGNTPATVIGVMPKGFGYPVNHDAWTPLSLRASYGALEGGAISVIGRLAPGVSREQANAELRVLGERAAAALPATHEHLRPRVRRLGEASDVVGHRAVRAEEPARAAGADHRVHERRHAGLREDGDTGRGNRRAFRARCEPRAHHRSTLRGGPCARVGRGRGRSRGRRPGVDVGD